MGEFSEEFINGTILNSIDKTLNGDVDSLSSAFLWHKTPQGHTHWMSIKYGMEKLDDESRSYLARLRDAVLSSNNINWGGK